MFRSLLIFTALALAGCRKGPREPRFAIEVPATVNTPAARVLVDEGFGSDSRVPLAALSPAAKGPENLAGWENLELNYTAEGSHVKVTVYAMHTEYDSRRHATTFRSMKLGSHTAGPRETVQLTELAKYGYVPLALRVVPAK